jgi:acetyl esterase/lipase
VIVPGIVLCAALASAQQVDTSPAKQSKRVEASLPAGVEERLDTVYARHGSREMRLDLFRPKNLSKPAPAIVVVHGGGWSNGDKTRFRALAQSLAGRGYVTAAIEYRLAGEAKFPAAVQDCNAAVRWLRAHAEECGIDANRIGAVGGSAGGHLVGLMAAAPSLPEFQAKLEGPAASASARIQAAVIMAGPFELATGPIAERSRQAPEQSNTHRWLGKSIDEAPELYRLASPLTHLSAATPPVLFMTGEHDHPEQNLASRARLRDLGVATDILVYKEGRHGCWNLHPWFGPMVDDMDAFFASTFKHESAGACVGRSKTPWGEIAQTSAGLELAVDEPPEDGLLAIPRLNNPISKVYVQQESATEALVLSPGPAQWSVALPKNLLRPGIVKLETVGRPYVPAIPRITTAAADGAVTLAAHDVVTHGELLRYEPQPHKNTVGYWAREEDWCEWHFYSEQPGRYDVHVLQGCGAGQGGSTVAVKLGGQQLTFAVEDTGHFQNFRDRTVGTVTIDAPAVYTLELRALRKAAKAVMDVREVRLVPVRTD